MSGICVAGCGAVSPAGWGVKALSEALGARAAAPARELARPGWTRPLRVKAVPPPAARPGFAAHPRLRRASPIAHHAAAAAIEALGDCNAGGANGAGNLGIIFCTSAGCVNYSSRFYGEVLKNPATASPLVFPETVYNAPASHLSALLGSTAVNYTLVGDQGTFLQGLALAADWLLAERVDGCLVVGAEELDWLISDAYRLFHRNAVVSDGAGAVYLRRCAPEFAGPQLRAITRPFLFSDRLSRAEAARRAREEIESAGPASVLCDGLQGIEPVDRDEARAWEGWAGLRFSPKRICGEGFMAGAAWQCVAAIEALKSGREAACVSVVGTNQQAIAAQFGRRAV